MPSKKTLLSSPRSYVSLLYGALTVVILFVILYFGVKAISQRKGTVGEDGLQTANMQKTHIVKKGDSLWTIAEKEYKDGYRWNDIARENKIINPDEIEIGMKLTLPPMESQATKPTEAEATEVEITPTPTSQPAMTEAQDMKITGNSYKVVEGDNLWDISVRAYGDGYKWVEIAKVNKLANPDLIHKGNQFKLPR